MRLHSERDFKRILNQRNRVTGKDYTIRYAPNDQSFPRVAVVVSRKNVRLATVRNEAKRIVKEAFRLLQHELGSYDFIVQVQKSANEAIKSDLRQCIDELFEQFIKHYKC